MNIIERWKNNEKPFGLMDEEMREKDREIRMKNKCEADFEVYGLDGEWRFYGNMNTPTMGTVLRLRADYQEPEAVDRLKKQRDRLVIVCQVFKGYLLRNDYGLQLHDIEKEIEERLAEAEGEK